MNYPAVNITEVKSIGRLNSFIIEQLIELEPYIGQTPRLVPSKTVTKDILKRCIEDGYYVESLILPDIPVMLNGVASDTKIAEQLYRSREVLSDTEIIDFIDVMESLYHPKESRVAWSYIDFSSLQEEALKGKAGTEITKT